MATVSRTTTVNFGFEPPTPVEASGFENPFCTFGHNARSPATQTTPATQIQSYKTDHSGVVVIFNVPKQKAQTYLDQKFGPGYTVHSRNGETVHVALVVTEEWTSLDSDETDPKFNTSGAQHGELFPVSIEVIDADGKIWYAVTDNVAVTTPTAKNAGDALGVDKELWDAATFSFKTRRGFLFASASAYLQDRRYPKVPSVPQSWLHAFNLVQISQDQISNQWFSLNWHGLALPCRLPLEQNFLVRSHQNEIGGLAATSNKHWGRVGFWSNRDRWELKVHNPEVNQLLGGLQPAGILMRRDAATITTASPPEKQPAPAADPVFMGCP